MLALVDRLGFLFDLRGWTGWTILGGLAIAPVWRTAAERSALSLW